MEVNRSSTWIPEIGNCISVSHKFKHKNERDYFASRANKINGYIKHIVWEVKGKFFCSIYLKGEL